MTATPILLLILFAGWQVSVWGQSDQRPRDAKVTGSGTKLGPAIQRSARLGSSSDRPVLHSVHRSRDFALIGTPRASQWRGVAPVLSENDDYGNPVRLPPTQIRSRWTDRNLYLLFSCPYDSLHLKPGPDTRYETPKLWDWDVAEAFIGSDPAHPERYREFEMSPQGEWIDLAIDRAHPALDNGASWNSGFRVRARIDAARRIWYGEMKIPLSAFEGKPSRVGLFRVEGKLEILWTPTNNPSFHVPETFGILQRTRKTQRPIHCAIVQQNREALDLI